VRHRDMDLNSAVRVENRDMTKNVDELIKSKLLS
jgi:hypothetical protein